MAGHDSFLDVLPRGWRYDRLKDVVALRNEKTDAVSAEEDYLELEDLESGSGRILNRRNTLDVESAVTLFKKGDVLFGKLRPYLEKYYEAEFDGKCTGEILAFKPERVASRFLFYCFGSRWLIERCNALAYGAKMPRVSWEKQLSQFNIPLPPLPEQQRIAAYLDASCAAIDAAVAAKRRQLETLDALRKSVVHDAVTNGLDKNAPRMASDSLYLPSVPAHWGIWSLKRCATILNGYAFDSTTYVEEGIPIIRIGDVATTIDWTKVKRVSPDVLPELSRFTIERDDILVALTGATIGKSALYRDETLALLNQRVAIFRAWRINSEFLNYVIQTHVFTEPIDLLCYGGAQDNIGKSEVGGIKIPVPPKSEQERIVCYLNEKTARFSSLTGAIQTQISILTAYRKSLIHECVTGQRRVTESPSPGGYGGSEAHWVCRQLSKEIRQLNREPSEKGGRLKGSGADGRQPVSAEADTKRNRT